MAPPMSFPTSPAMPTWTVQSLFEPDQASWMETCLDKYFDAVIQKLHNDQKVHNRGATSEQLQKNYLNAEVKREGEEPQEYFRELTNNVLMGTTHCASPLMIGHMTSALPFFHRPLARLVTAFNQNTVKLETSSLVSSLERETVAKLHHLLFQKDPAFYLENTHSPEVSLGTITSGGTLANLTGLWVARNKALGPTGSFKGVEQEGLHRALRHHQYDDAVIIGSQLLHYSFKKAADILGVGTSGLLTVPCADDFRVRVDLMEAEILRCIESKTVVLALVGVAGATETGSVDDLEAIAALARKYQIHFHVDAAWGGPLVFSKKYRGLMKGIHLADSITVDGHKQLYTPMGCGVILFNDPTSPQSIKKTSNYIIRNDSLDAGKFSMEGSRPATALYLHASLSILGAQGYEAIIDRNCAMAKTFAAKVQEAPDFEIISEPTSNIFLYRWIPRDFLERWRNASLTLEDNEAINAKNRELQGVICREGDSFVSRTSIFSNAHNAVVSVLRVVIANPNTKQEHLDFALNEQRKFIRALQPASN